METEAFLLSQVAAALNACERAGMTLDLSHGAVTSRQGYVLPGPEGWSVRLRTDLEAVPRREITEGDVS
jgi:hypothetical protein